MSDRKVAKNRFHKGMTAYLRLTLRKVGVSLDEEMAQFALGGVNPFAGPPRDYIAQVVTDALSQRRQLMQTWETENPDKNPYPPSFPERALKLIREAQEACFNEDSPVIALEKLMVMCEAELKTDPTTTDSITEEN